MATVAGETFVYSFTQSNIGTSAQITDKLTDLSQGATSQPPAGDKGCFTELRGMVIRQLVVSETHVAMLTEDGRICRIRYTEETTPPQPLATPTAGREKSDDEAASTSSTRSYGSRSASPRPDEDRPSSNSLSHVWGSIMSSGPSSAVLGSGGGLRVPGRGRILLRRRGGGHGIVARWPVIPAGDVPDELVDQAMAVLQGKSKEMVIRELQKTNLDVNQAVNNLLSREDDDGDASHDEGSVLASGEELLNLLGPGLANVGEEELDEVLARRGEEGGGSGRDSRLTLYEFSDPLLQVSELRSLVSIGDGAAGGGVASSGGGVASGEGSSKRPNTRGGLSSKKKKSPSTSQAPPLGPLLFDSSIEWWGEDKDGPLFKLIAGLYSELLAVDSNGKLHGWAWSCPTPYPGAHPLETRLEIGEESVRMLSCKLLRGSLVTESGKVATFVDGSVREFASRLEGKAVAVSELSGENISTLSVSELVSAIATESGKVYWWGVLPFPERKQAVAQNQEKLRVLKYQYTGSGSELIEGSRVCLRLSPVYSVGTKAVLIKGSRIQCGVLLENVMSPNLSEKCQFRVVTPGNPQEMEADNNKTEDTLDMHIGSKRKHPSNEHMLTKIEEWSLRDVVFTEHVTNHKEGSVVKLDGNYAAVHYPPLDPNQLSQVNLASCRLLRKDELVLVSEASPHHTPYFIQEVPRRLRPPHSYTLLTIATDTRGLHCLYAARELLHYVVFNLDSGKLLQDSQFSLLSSQYLLKQGGALQLTPINLSVGVVMDEHGGLFPVSKNNTGNIRDLPQLNVPPISCVGVGVCSNRNSLVSVVFQRQRLMPAILRKDLTTVSHLIASFKAQSEDALSPESIAALKEHCSGGCNVFHVLAALARPVDPTPVSGDKKGSGAARSTPRGLLRDIMKQAMAMSRTPPSLSSMDWAGTESVEVDDEPQSDIALDIFERLVSLEAHAPLYAELLQERSLDGYTPFMAAVTFKSYGLACLLLHLAQQLSGEDQTTLTAMLYPPDTHPDDNPVFILVRNDPCSFTWTGEEHIQQDIFECRTCGLIGSLCCCTECAYTCHRGHDCSFKKASPTAYCDCWEVGKCHALASGYEYERRSLLEKLLKCSDLGTRVNARGEHLIGLLASMVARQGKEQSHWGGGRLGGSFRTSRSKHEEIPSYNLPPPRFAQKALNMVLENWECVKGVLLCGCEGVESVEGHVDTTSLDCFTHLLLTRLSQKNLDSMLTLLVKQLGPAPFTGDAVSAAARLLRSVIRVFTVAQLESTAVASNVAMDTSRKKSHSPTVLMERCQKVFSSLAPLTVRQLVPMAKAVILPVMLGVARPMDPLCMSERGRVCEDVFRLPLVSLLRLGACQEEVGGEGEGADSELGEEDPPTHALDASSTVTTGSHLLYLSDQDSSDGEEVESVPDDVSLAESHEDYSLFEPATPHPVTTGTHWALPHTRSTYHSSSRLARSNNTGRDVQSMGMSASLLSQTFCLLLRQLAETLDPLWDKCSAPSPPDTLHVSEGEPRELYDFVWEELQDVWTWLFNCLDVLQSQLSFGSIVSKKVSRTTSPPSKHEAGSESREHRKEAFSYMLTLFKGGCGEHGGRVPSLDVGGMEHLAFTLDSLYHLLQNTRSPPPSEGASERPQLPASEGASERPPELPASEGDSEIPPELPASEGASERPPELPASEGDSERPPELQASVTVSGDVEMTDEDEGVVPEEMGVVKQKGVNQDVRKFFHRSNSTVCLGKLPHSPFDPLVDVLPLAEKPQLMDSVQDKQVLFGYQAPMPLCQWPSCSLAPPPILSLLSDKGGWPRGSEAGSSGCQLSDDQVCGWDSHKLAASILIGRWDLCLEVFGRAFMDTVGKLRGSVLCLEQQFKQRDKQFRREMDLLRSSNHKEMIFEVDRSRDKFLSGLFQKLNHFCDHRLITGSQGSTPLLVHRLKVTFAGEQGEGSGVLRSMFTVTAEAVLSDDPPPTIEMMSVKLSSDTPTSRRGGGGASGRRSRDKSRFSVSSLSALKRPKRGPSSLDPPLFYQPGKIGFYAPRVATNTPERLNAYRNIGRLIGLCLLHTEVMTLPLCRHVFKFLLRREISWHDLAFFDPGVYESMRKMILESRNPDGAAYLSTLGLSFSLTLRPEEGGASHDLLEGRGAATVTPDNVYEYVRQYALLRMVTINQDPLEQLREGMYEAIPESVLSQLSAEDLRLLLCGCPHIDVDVVRGITVFEDESRKDQEQLSRFKGWFWSVVERMTQRERQDLLYFWTSSPVLPASVDSYQPPPSVTIRPPDDQHLPTANTCISRLYVPLYSSKAILRTRLLTAIKTKAFGFV